MREVFVHIWESLRSALPWLSLLVGLISLIFGAFGPGTLATQKQFAMSFGSALVAGGFFSLVAKSILFTGIFKKEIQSVYAGEDFRKVIASEVERSLEKYVSGKVLRMQNLRVKWVLSRDDTGRLVLDQSNDFDYLNEGPRDTVDFASVGPEIGLWLYARSSDPASIEVEVKQAPDITSLDSPKSTTETFSTNASKISTSFRHASGETLAYRFHYRYVVPEISSDSFNSKRMIGSAQFTVVNYADDVSFILYSVLKENSRHCSGKGDGQIVVQADGGRVDATVFWAKTDAFPSGWEKEVEELFNQAASPPESTS